MRKQFRSEYLDKLAQNAHRRQYEFPELDNLTSVDIEVHGFRRGEEKVKESVSWEEVEKMLEGGSIWK